MKTLQKITFSLLLTMAALMSSASTNAATCAQSASWATFQAVGTCTIGDIQLSNFNLVSTANPTGAAIPASSITLTLNNTMPGQLGMQWNMGMSATGVGNFQDLFFTFMLTGLNNLMFTGDNLTFNGSATGGGTTGVSSVVCTSGPVGTCPVNDKYQAAVFNPPPVLGDTMSFPASSTIWASKDFIVSGADGGTGQISSVTNTYTFSNVPEPITFVLMGAGLVGIAALRRRNNNV